MVLGGAQPPERVVPVPLQQDGAGVRVAVIDSGVDPSHPWFAEASLSHLRLERHGKAFRVVEDEGGDQSGHGTACAGIIHRMVPAATIVSLRALGPDGRCSRGALITALQHCVRERFGVVNLSLGIDIPRKMPLKVADHLPILSLYELADVANTLGVVLVASGPNVAQFRTYPGRFKALIGVGRGNFAELSTLRSARTQDHELLAPGTDVVAPALGGGERRWTGTSFACPFVTGHVARILAARSGLPIEAVKASLHAIAAEQQAGPAPPKEQS
ncbi:MAG: alkaline protease [Deltaproteobacteria bacterium]|nr:MAG: alkaline protease [Deltaproteobacteria bacterium]